MFKLSSAAKRCALAGLVPAWRSAARIRKVILYALGFWSDEEAESIDADLRDRILSRPRARELRHMKAPDMSLKEFRDKFAGPGISDDDALLNYFAGAESVRAKKAAGPVREYAAAAAPLLGLIQQLAAQSERRSIDIQRADLKLRLRRL